TIPLPKHVSLSPGAVAASWRGEPLAKVWHFTIVNDPGLLLPPATASPARSSSPTPAQFLQTSPPTSDWSPSAAAAARNLRCTRHIDEGDVVQRVGCRQVGQNSAALSSPGVPKGNERASGDGKQRRVARRQAVVDAVGPLGGGLGVTWRGRLLGGRCCGGAWAGLALHSSCRSRGGGRCGRRWCGSATVSLQQLPDLEVDVENNPLAAGGSGGGSGGGGGSSSQPVTPLLKSPTLVPDTDESYLRGPRRSSGSDGGSRERTHLRAWR
ncbi:hypothetical protein HK405_011691, partial [Cladochytrium tenue]